MMIEIGLVKFLSISAIQAFYLIMLLVLRDYLTSRYVWLQPELKMNKVALVLAYAIPSIVIGLTTKTLLVEVLCGICGWLFVTLLKVFVVKRNEH